jgi:hypothetical protein
METTVDGRHRILVRRRMPAPREVAFFASHRDAKRTADPYIECGLRRDNVPWAHPFPQAFGIGPCFIDGLASPGARRSDRSRHAREPLTWSGLDNPKEITLVTVEFIPQGTESELVITHERFIKADVAQRYEMGWGTIARRFAEYLAGNRSDCGQPSIPRIALNCERPD